MAAAAGVLPMKLLVDTKSQRVVFAEAGKDVVDFLFSLLALPLATAVALVGDRSVAGSVGSLYVSVQGLDMSYLLPGADRDDLLRPTVVGTASSSLHLLPPPPSKTVFACPRCGGGGYGYGYSYGSARRFVTDARGAACPNCTGPMTDPVQYISSSSSSAAAAAGSSGGSTSHVQRGAGAGGPSSAQGFVREAVTYTVKDDLTVTPMSTISSITLLKAFAATDLAALQEMTVYLGYREGLEILKASLQSKTVLTDVFLGNKGWSSSGTA